MSKSLGLTSTPPLLCFSLAVGLFAVQDVSRRVLTPLDQGPLRLHPRRGIDRLAGIWTFGEGISRDGGPRNDSPLREAACGLTTSARWGLVEDHSSSAGAEADEFSF